MRRLVLLSKIPHDVWHTIKVVWERNESDGSSPTFTGTVTSDFNEMKRWCTDEIGNESLDWYQTTGALTAVFGFRSRDSMILFKLRFG